MSLRIKKTSPLKSFSRFFTILFFVIALSIATPNAASAIADEVVNRASSCSYSYILDADDELIIRELCAEGVNNASGISIFKPNNPDNAPQLFHEQTTNDGTSIVVNNPEVDASQGQLSMRLPAQTAVTVTGDIDEIGNVETALNWWGLLQDDEDDSPEDSQSDEDSNFIDIDEAGAIRGEDFVDGGDDSGPQCVSEGGFTGFISCDLLTTIIGWIAGLQEAIARVLFESDPLVVGATEDPRYQVWSTFRDIANGLLILAFMSVIFSLALSLNVDAYTVKKMVPRLLVAAIAIQASYFISALMVDATNVLGAGINAVFNAAISDIAIEFGAGQALGSDLAIGGILLAGGATLILAAPSIMFILLLLFIVILGALVVVALRDLFIIMAIVLSPFAFLANLLPATERWYKFWWSNFLRLLFMYPFIVLMIQLGNLGSYIVLNS